MTFSLLIVESPAKCKKIESFLGPNFKCLASFGHFRELNKLENINLETLKINIYLLKFCNYKHVE